MTETRLQRLVNAMPQEFEAALVLTAPNRFYFLDFDSHDAGALLITRDEAIYWVDSRYIEAASAVQSAKVMLEEDLMAQLCAVLEKSGVRRLHVELGISLQEYGTLKEKLQNVEIISNNTLSNKINALRAIKDGDEMERMQGAQHITDACFAHILPFIKEGVREIDLMLEMEHYMRSHGAQNVAFDTICVAGPNSSRPHGVPGEYRVRPGDFITMDFGAKHRGYCSDMTRTVALGFVGDEQKAVYNLVLKAHLAGIEAARGGTRGNQVDAVARDIIDGAGYKGCFGHGLGHAVGIEIHEDPRFSPKCSSEILPGMMMTVEPGCYLPGRFGCRIEDMVYITQDGCVPLPQSPKELIVL